MTTKNEGDRLYPEFKEHMVISQGVSLRDWFAGMALPYVGNLLLRRLDRGKIYTADDIAEMAFEVADAMIEESQKGGER